MTRSGLTACFPWYGGKSLAADVVWPAFGNVPNYVEPFAGSLAILLARPHEAKVETVNDLDAYICNFWRAVRADSALVAHWADWPVSEVDLHARHGWLVARRDQLTEQLLGDPDAYDAKVAGWWVWGICQWIGSGWCSRPNWRQRPHLSHKQSHLTATERKRPLLARSGIGLLRRPLPSVGGPGRGIHNKLPNVGRPSRGIHGKKLNTGSSGLGIHARGAAVAARLAALADRLRDVRVTCGEWRRILGWSTLGIDTRHGMAPTGVFLDPPYDHEVRSKKLYSEDAPGLSAQVREWALEHGDHPLLRVALCGYEGEHEMPSTWRCVRWKSKGGHANADRERIWFSPHCLPVEHAQRELFGRSGAA